MNENLSFLNFPKMLNEDIGILGTKIEEMLFDHPDIAATNARKYAELIINQVIKEEKLINISNLSLFDKVRYLSEESKGILTKEVYRAIDFIRKHGNSAVHTTERVLISDALKIHRNCYIIADWYVSNYSKDINIPKYEEPIPTKLNHQELIKVELDQKFNQKFIEMTKTMETHLKQDINISNQKNTDNESKDDLADDKSYLLAELNKLKDSSQQAIENAKSFSQFKSYIHIERQVQKDVEQTLNKVRELTGPQLVLLCGSVGDGKSHLLAYLNEKKPHLLEGFRIKNDATESYSPYKNAIETLEEDLTGFSDENIGSSQEKVILAINVGVLQNFLDYDFKNSTFNSLKKFINDSNVFSKEFTNLRSNNNMHIVGFTDYKTFELSKEGLTSELYSGIISKVFSTDEENPFYIAYQKDSERKLRLIIHENFEFLCDLRVQWMIVQLVIKTIIKDKLVISTRVFNNFLADIVIPEQYKEEVEELNDFRRLSCITPNLLFSSPDRSVLLERIYQLDPVNIRNERVDELILDVNTEKVLLRFEEKYFSNKNIKLNNWFSESIQQIIPEESLIQQEDINEFVQVFIRTQVLLEPDFTQLIITDSYKAYSTFLYDYNKGNSKNLKDLYNMIKDSVFNWKGSPGAGYIYLDRNEKHKIAQQLNIEANLTKISQKEQIYFHNFSSTLEINFSKKNEKEKNYSLEIDYVLFDLLFRIHLGYCRTKKDEDNAIQFIEFVDKIMHLGNKAEELIVHIPSESKKYSLSKDEFESYSFKKV